jgi:hypothetical protein
VSDDVLRFPPLPGTRLAGSVRAVALKFRAGYSDERLSEREIDALCPVLPELVSELLAVMALDNERE